MSLILVFHNDNTGGQEDSNYDVTTYVNEKIIWTGRVENHNREDGWKKLVMVLAKQFDE